MRRRSALVAFAAVVGPGILAGLSDDDPAGITTYSVIGADYGYTLLWVLLLSTAALIVFHELGARMGIATGQGLAGLVRQRFGVRWAMLGLAALVVANLGATCADFAGVAASLELAGIDRRLSVPLVAIALSLLVLRGGFRRVEHVFLALAAVFAAYIAAGILAEPDWGATATASSSPRSRRDATRSSRSPPRSARRSRHGGCRSSSPSRSTSGSRRRSCAWSGSTS